MEKRFGGGHYSGELRLHEKEFHVNYGEGNTIFIENCNDLFAETVPAEWINRILAHCWMYPKNCYVFQTKNPFRVMRFRDFLPPFRVVGTTIETIDDEVLKNVAPFATGAYDRIYGIECLKRYLEKVFVTIEPILKGDLGKLAHELIRIRPEFVNIGADSKGIGLPEPSYEEIVKLAQDLQSNGIEVRKKLNLERLMK